MSAAAAPQKPEPNSNGSSALSEVKPFVRPIHMNVDDRVDARGLTYVRMPRRDWHGMWMWMEDGSRKPII